MSYEYHPKSAFEILEATAQRIGTIKGFKFVEINRMKPVLPEEDDQVPYALVYNDGEAVMRNGDHNCGNPWFDHTLKMVVEIVIRETTEEACFLNSNAVIDIVRERLLGDLTWMDMHEGILQISHEAFIPHEGNLYLIGARLNIDVTFRSEWRTNITDDLDCVALSIIDENKTSQLYKEISFHERTRNGHCLSD